VKINERQKQDFWTPVNRNKFLKEGASDTFTTFTTSQFDTIKKIEKPETPDQVTQEHKDLNEQDFIKYKSVQKSLTNTIFQ
jgi:hypothetical protein